MKDYEGIMILQPELQADALEMAFKEALDLLKNNECTIDSVDEWGKKPLSYEIRKKKEGTFYLVNFQGKSENIDKIKRELSLNENVLRAMISTRKKEQAQNTTT